MHRLEEKLIAREKEGNLRTLASQELPIDFLSNDYLGLARNVELYNAIACDYTLVNDHNRLNGSTGSRLLSGNNVYYQETELFLAEYFKSESALLFNSGYDANVAILSTIPQKGDTIIYDELIHASLKEGARLSFAKRISFKHNNLDDLASKLAKSGGERFVVVESVYSMDGDFSHLENILSICQKYSAQLILDEAHSTGIWGIRGEGIACEKEIHPKIFARIHTFGKAIGVHGACVVGSKIFTDYLINFARPFIYTTCLPMHSIVSIKSSLKFLSNHIQLREDLFKVIFNFRNSIQSSFGDKWNNFFCDSHSPIQILKIPGNDKVRNIASHLQERGFNVKPILSPTVREGKERIRICLHAYNKPEQIRALIQVLIKHLT